MVLARLDLRCCLLLGLALAAAPCSADQQPRALLQGLGTIRLAPYGWQGRLEILNNGYWGTVCEDGFDDRDANVVCRQLGFAGGRAHWGAYFGAGTGGILASRLDCTGLETSLDRCRSVQWAPKDCDHSEDVSVVCYSSPDRAPIQLVGGPEPGQGRLEVQGLDGSWGGVCATGWRHENTAIICRQLGYNSNSSAILGASAFGWGAAAPTVQMNGVSCSGSERYLAACYFGGWGVSGCDPEIQLVGIDCLGSISRPLPPEVAQPPWVGPEDQPGQPPTAPNDLSPSPARLPPPPPPRTLYEGPPSDLREPDMAGEQTSPSPPPPYPDMGSPTDVSMPSPPPPKLDVWWPVEMPSTPNSPPSHPDNSIPIEMPSIPSAPPPNPPPSRPTRDAPDEESPPASPDLDSLPPAFPLAAPLEPGPPLAPPPGYASSPPPFYPDTLSAPGRQPGGHADQPEPPYGGYRPSPPGNYPYVPTGSPPRHPTAGYPLEPQMAAPASPPEGLPPAAYGSPQPPRACCSDAANNASTYLPAGTLGGPLQPHPTGAPKRLLLRLLCPEGTHATGLVADNAQIASTFSLDCDVRTMQHPPSPPPPAPEAPSRHSRQLRVHTRGDCDRRRRLLRAVSAPPGVVGEEEGAIGPPMNLPPGNARGMFSARAMLEDSEGRPMARQPVYMGAFGSLAVSQGGVRFNCPQGFDSLRAQVSGSLRWPTQLALRCGGSERGNWTEPALGLLPVQVLEPIEMLQCPPGLLLTGMVASTVEAISGSGQELVGVEQPYLVVESLTLYCGSCPSAK